jgi:exopolysaccharide biosynthesis polyprenyl glycosylphosphotransferase
VSVPSSVEHPLPAASIAGPPAAPAIRGVVRGAARAAGRAAGYSALARNGDAIVGLLALGGGYLAANLGRMPAGLEEFLGVRLTVRSLILLVVFMLGWRLLCERAGLYNRRRIPPFSWEARRVLAVCLVAAAGAMTLPIISRTGAFSPLAVLYFGMAALGGLLLWRGVLRTLSASGTPDVREILIVGSGPRAWSAYLELHRDPEIRHQFIGFVDSDDRSASEEVRRHWAGSLADLEQVLMRRTVDEVVIALPIRSRYSEIQLTIETCWRVGVRCKYLADVFDHGRATARFEEGERFNAIGVAVAPEDGRLLIKRALDIVAASLGLAMLAPVLAVAALAIRLNGPGPVLFVQERHGLHKRRFRMYKLRTMVPDAEFRQSELEARNEASGPVFKIRSDPRITRVGRVLRRTSLDELPQLWNVLRGDMSLVGPRPLPIRDVGLFNEGALMRRFSVRPGITGLWQVERHGTLEFDEWVRLDMQYIDEWSLELDLRILARTLPAVVRGSGAA